MYDELSAKGHDGSGRFVELCESGTIAVAENAAQSLSARHAGLQGLGRGEAESLELKLRGTGDFVVVDDRKAARACVKLGIPYINALLCLRILYECSLMAKPDYDRGFDELVAIGRYSEAIVAFARECPRESISFFYP